MNPPIALQLYSVREYAQEKGFEDAVRRVAAMGYVGVEPAGFPGTTAEAAGALFKELGLEVCSAHTALPIGEQKDDVLSTMKAIGSTRIISGIGPDGYTSLDEIKKTCATFNQAAAVARDNGMTFGVHNHWWEYTPVEGEYPYKLMLDMLDPDVFFEIDTYWVQTAGVDVVDVVKTYGARAPLLHIKDGPCVKTEPMTAVGDGVMDVPAIVEAGGANATWLVVELDRCATDMMEAVQRSVTYLAEKKLGRAK